MAALPPTLNEAFFTIGYCHPDAILNLSHPANYQALTAKRYVQTTRS